ncbi:TetR/AcrR family transcriptional regulator [Microbacterium terricola]|uniref:TetR family transcriptional regulator n=1 Tax=Microbacterium terricola TaxID=344163 RepID=A0ABM8E2T3_9MICO|nr:TetR/AcrR family transcriptional regulator [Microbacterium terricola]UYK40024.1 TetR/AcrR family transcriptional regulator [Microbacterium terricola]BDV32284.1 TetR family transcriptional regulator [Microbacterium terricola]
MAARGPYAKGVAKRDEILDAAMEVFAQNGYDRTSVREIARQTGLSQAGLLHHFSTKEELFLEVLRRRDDRSLDSDERSHKHSVDRLMRAVDRNSEEPGLVRLFVAMSAESAQDASVAHGFFAERYRWLLDEIAQDVRVHQASGELPAGLDPEGIASLLVAAADGLQLQWLLNPGSVDMGARIRTLWEALRKTT